MRGPLQIFSVSSAIMTPTATRPVCASNRANQEQRKSGRSQCCTCEPLKSMIWNSCFCRAGLKGHYSGIRQMRGLPRTGPLAKPAAGGAARWPADIETVGNGGATRAAPRTNGNAPSGRSRPALRLLLMDDTEAGPTGRGCPGRWQSSRCGEPERS